MISVLYSKAAIVKHYLVLLCPQVILEWIRQAAKISLLQERFLGIYRLKLHVFAALLHHKYESSLLPPVITDFSQLSLLPSFLLPKHPRLFLPISCIFPNWIRYQFVLLILIPCLCLCGSCSPQGRHHWCVSDNQWCAFMEMHLPPKTWELHGITNKSFSFCRNGLCFLGSFSISLLLVPVKRCQLGWWAWMLVYKRSYQPLDSCDPGQSKSCQHSSKNVMSQEGLFCASISPLFFTVGLLKVCNGENISESRLV